MKNSKTGKTNVILFALIFKIPKLSSNKKLDQKATCEPFTQMS